LHSQTIVGFFINFTEPIQEHDFDVADSQHDHEKEASEYDENFSPCQAIAVGSSSGLLI